MKQKIALVDDDQNILTSVAMALESEGFDIITYADGQSAIEGLERAPVDLVVLDIKMPRLDGMEVLRRLRQRSAIPVIFLTSKDDEADQFIGLRMGADDYITKPFSQRLLIARIHALLRRQSLAHAQSPQNIFTRGELTLDDARHVCSWKGKAIDLTVTEYLIVKSLVQNPGHVKSREQLMSFAYGDSVYVDDRTVDSHIKRLRKKFRLIDDTFEGIETVYGLGYRYKDE